MAGLWEQKAYKLLHHYILKYTEGTTVKPEWVAGLISVECAGLNPKANRFEPHVYESVMWVKKGNKSTAFPGFNSGRIKSFIEQTSDIAKLKSVATSYGFGQLMGYHYINKWSLKPEQYMNLSFEDSVKYLVLFMVEGMRYVKFPQLEKGTRKYQPYEQLLRWHNTGSTSGTTYHPDYVKRATEMAEKYRIYAESQEKKANESNRQPKL